MNDYLKIINMPTNKFIKIRLSIMIFSVVVAAIILFFNQNYIGLLITIVGLMIAYTLPKMAVKNKAMVKSRQVYYDFPLWLSSLEVLILSNNIPNTLKYSIQTCPPSFKQDLIELVNKLENDPTNQDYYSDFLSYYHYEDIHEMMLDLHQFNYLNKAMLLHEFNNLHQRINKISVNNRKVKYDQQIFLIGAINSIPLFLLSIYILLIANMLSNTLMGG